MMKHKIYSLLAAAAIALTGLSLTACSEDDLDTNQYVGGVSLNVYGPQPVMRGGTLRFLGSNLDQIAQVRIPGVDPITNIEVVKSGVPSEIRVTVPKDGPLEGYVTLVTKTDKEITTKTKLTYSEPIVFDAIKPASAMPGEIITIEGDYLNLVQMVEFADNVLVSQEDFVSHDRYAIKVVVPETARTGSVKLYDLDLTIDENATSGVAYNIMESETALEVGTPTVSKLASPRGEAAAQGTITVKQGETVNISGSNLSLVSAVKFGEGDDAVEITEFTANGSTLSFALPAEAPDGAVNLILRSDIEVPAGSITTVAPSNTVATPAPVKANQTLTINGNDLDVVAAIEFPDADGEYTISMTEFQSNTAEALAITVPETATEGNLILRMTNGKGVEVPFTLVKPVATAYDINPVSAGGKLTITGTDLDLVKSVTFGEAEAEVEATETTLSLTVPMAGTSGKPLLNLANGTSIEAPEIAINEAVFCYIPELPEFGDDNTPEAGGTFTIGVVNGDKLTNVQVNGTEVNFVYSDKKSELTFGIPAAASATSKVKLISSNGEIEYDISVIPQGEITNVIFNGPFELTWSTSTQGMISQNSFDNLPDNGEVTLVFDYTVTGDNPQMKVNNGSWGHIDLLTGLAPAAEIVYALDPTTNKLEVPLSASAIENIKAGATDWGGILILHGNDAILNKISLNIKISLEQNLAKCVVNQGDMNQLMPFPIAMAWDDSGRFRLLIDKDPAIKDMKLKAGSSKMFFYTSGTGQLQINDANWTSFTTLADWENAEPKVMELVLTQDMIDWLKGEKSDGWSSTGFIIQGDGMTLTKVTILP